MLRGAIWDLDGTILDSMSAWDHVGENYLRSQGIEPEPDLDEAIATMSLHQAADYFIEHYGVKQTQDELIKSAVAIVDDFYRYEAQLKPHLKEFLAQLHETGVKMCIATATERSLVEAGEKVEKAGKRRHKNIREVLRSPQEGAASLIH